MAEHTEVMTNTEQNINIEDVVDELYDLDDEALIATVVIDLLFLEVKHKELQRSKLEVFNKKSLSENEVKDLESIIKQVEKTWYEETKRKILDAP